MRFTTGQRETLARMMDFNHVVTTDGDGNVTDGPNLWVPDYVWTDETHDCETDSEEWEPLTGHTGQYGYHGAVMHESEYIGGGMADVILEDAGIYVAVPVYWGGEDTRDADIAEAEGPEICGWAVLRYVGEGE